MDNSTKILFYAFVAFSALCLFALVMTKLLDNNAKELDAGCTVEAMHSAEPIPLYELPIESPNSRSTWL